MQLADSLCAVSSALAESRGVHMKKFGTLVPHIFMGDVLAHLGYCLLPGSGPAVANGRAEITGILESLESAMTVGDRETRNVVSISFVGDGRHEPFFHDLEPLLGPKTRAQLKPR